jgi:hypothetical protein
MIEWEVKTRKRILKEAIERGWSIQMGRIIKIPNGNIYGNRTILKKRGFECVLIISAVMMQGEINMHRNLADDLFPHPLIIICPYDQITEYHLGTLLSKTRIKKPDEFWGLVESLMKNIEVE